MPRKKQQGSQEAHGGADAATAVAEPDGSAAAVSTSRPDYIDGPPVADDGTVIHTPDPQQKGWSDPYKALFTGHGFEMGENRRFKQRVFVFKEKPSDEVLATLKESGFTYRAAEKAWTVPADADTRKLSDDLARQFAGPGQGFGR